MRTPIQARRLAAILASASAVAIYGCLSAGCAHETQSGETAHPVPNYGPAPCPSPGGGHPDYCCVNGALPPTPAAGHPDCPGAVLGPDPGGNPPLIPPTVGAPSHDPIERANREFKAVNNLGSIALPVALSANQPKTAEATADKAPAPGGPQLSGAGSAHDNTPSINVPGGGGTGHGGGGGGGGGSSGGGGFSPGNLKTSSNPESGSSDSTNALGTGSAASSGGTYSAGNSAGNHGGGSGGGAAYVNGIGGGLWNPNAGGSGDENNVGAADMNGTSGSDKGAKAGPGDQGGEDPEDYFKRLGIGENLFKIVERRYTRKAQTWVDEDLSKIKMKDLKLPVKPNGLK